MPRGWTIGPVTILGHFPLSRIPANMPQTAKQVVVLGATGSIGRSTLEVIAHCDADLHALAISAHSRLEEAAQLAEQAGAQYLIATCPEAAAKLKANVPAGTQLVVGTEELCRIATLPEVDVVVAAIVGSAGLDGAWAALEAGKTVALANKETLVMAGPLAMRLAAERNAKIIPVDSEHSAIFQALAAGRHEEVKRVVLTASGGPFRNHTQEQLENVTVEQALNHPTWRMGPKISVDSATMMNKALEIIEARWLFDLQPEQIDVVIHPQSIVHSMVEYRDGSTVAQLSPPDMKLPIQYALTYPHRVKGPAASLDLTQPIQLEFAPPDFERFPALQLGLEVARQGGTTGAVLNAANEAAVANFLDGRMAFTDIVSACRATLDHHNYDPNPSLDELKKLDRWARQEVSKWVCT
jgi:1-deoxy-D-xylulose-5-phosphate reductoisomerase